MPKIENREEYETKNVEKKGKYTKESETISNIKGGCAGREKDGVGLRTENAVIERLRRRSLDVVDQPSSGNSRITNTKRSKSKLDGFPGRFLRFPREGVGHRCPGRVGMTAHNQPSFPTELEPRGDQFRAREGCGSRPGDVQEPERWLGIVWGGEEIPSAESVFQIFENGSMGDPSVGPCISIEILTSQGRIIGSQEIDQGPPAAGRSRIMSRLEPQRQPFPLLGPRSTRPSFHSRRLPSPPYQGCGLQALG